MNILKFLIFLLVLHPTKDLLPLFFLLNVAYPRYRTSIRVIRDRSVFIICYISTFTVHYNAVIKESREIFSLNQTSPLVLTVTMYVNISSHNQYTLHEIVYHVATVSTMHSGEYKAFTQKYECIHELNTSCLFPLFILKCV